jgi:hypothetical protein
MEFPHLTLPLDGGGLACLPVGRGGGGHRKSRPPPLHPLPPGEGKMLSRTSKMSGENFLRWTCRDLNDKTGGRVSLLPSREMLEERASVEAGMTR